MWPVSPVSDYDTCEALFLRYVSKPISQLLHSDPWIQLEGKRVRGYLCSSASNHLTRVETFHSLCLVCGRTPILLTTFQHPHNVLLSWNTRLITVRGSVPQSSQASTCLTTKGICHFVIKGRLNLWLCCVAHICEWWCLCSKPWHFSYEKAINPLIVLEIYTCLSILLLYCYFINWIRNLV